MRLETANGIRILRIEAGRANAINLEFLANFDRLLSEAAGRPLVVTGTERFFSAGLDLPSLLAANREQVHELMTSFHRVFVRLFLHPAPVVAFVNGHAMAGGCVLAMQADYRFMAAGDFKIGLNEVQLGIGLPTIVIESFRCQLPPANLNRVTLEGPVFTPDDAVRAGLVHEIGDLARAVERCEFLARISRAAYAQVKLALRKPAVDAMERNREADTRAWLDICMDPDTRKRVIETVQRLGRNQTRPPSQT